MTHAATSDRPRPAWREVDEALARYDRAALWSRVHEWMDEFLPRRIVRVKGQVQMADLPTYQRRLDLLLTRSLGAFYGYRGWRVANETFGGCFCHSFLHEYGVEPRVDGVERAASWVLDETDALVRCLREFAFAFREVPLSDDPGDRAASMSLAIDRVFTAVIDASACNAAWPRYVSDGVLWLFDHRSIETPPVLVDLVDDSVSALCDEPTAPAHEARFRLCDDLAAVAVFASLP